MIKGNLKNLDLLVNLGENFKKAIGFLNTLDIETLTPQRYEIDGDKVYAFFCEVDLQEPSKLKLEAHRRYADIQLVTSGQEGMEYAPTDILSVNTEYNEEQDIAFYDNSESVQLLTVSAGEYAVFLPKDAHKPNCITNGVKKSKKLVIKVRL